MSELIQVGTCRECPFHEFKMLEYEGKVAEFHRVCKCPGSTVYFAETPFRLFMTQIFKEDRPDKCPLPLTVEVK